MNKFGIAALPHVEIWFDADVECGIPANRYPFSGDVGGMYRVDRADDLDWLAAFNIGHTSKRRK
jgi:hypothetical protein